MSSAIASRQSQIENPKNIILRNPKIPGQVRRARKSELKWYAERGWRPDDRQQMPDARPEKQKETKQN